MGVTARYAQARRRRVQQRQPAGVVIESDGGLLIPPGVDLCLVLDLFRYGGRFGGLTSRWNRLIRPVRPTNLRNKLRQVRSLVQRSRYGIGDQDAWWLGGYLCEVAARGLRGHDPDHADALGRWVRVACNDAADDKRQATQSAQGVLRWIAGHLDELDDVEPAPSRAYLRRTLQRGRFGIADTDVDLARHLSGIAARGMRTIADRGYGYPTNRLDEHEWHAELHRAADALQRWATTPQGQHTLQRSAPARDAWLWIADNLEQLWD